MRLLDKDLIDKWEDGSIPKAGKNELIVKFQRYFGYTSKSSVFTGLLAGRSQPTPEQYKFLKENINSYWAFYNPVDSEQPTSKSTA